MKFIKTARECWISADARIIIRELPTDEGRPRCFAVGMVGHDCDNDRVCFGSAKDFVESLEKANER